MTFLKARWLIVVMLGLVTLAGCGGSGSSSMADPFAANHEGSAVPSPGSGTVQDYNLSLLPSTTAMLANEEQIVTATLKNADNRPVANQTIAFVVKAGPATAVTTSMRTDSNGVALAFIRAGTTTATTNVIVQASASIGDSTVLGYGKFQVSPRQDPLSGTKLALSVPSFAVKAKEQLVVTATAKDSLGHPVANQTVKLGIAAGPAAMLTTTATTDSNGTLVALVQAGNVTAVSNVIVAAITKINGRDITAVIPFQIVPQVIPVITYSMTMAASKPVVDNNQEFYVTALLLDSNQAPVVGKPVMFTIASGGGTVKTSTVNTDSTGKAIATIRAGDPGFTVTLIEASANVNGILVTALAPVQIQNCTMSITPSTSVVNNDQDFYVTAVLTDSNGVPISGKPVTFSIPMGPGTVNTSTINTDSTGKAIATIRAGNPGSTASMIVEASANINGAVVTALAPVTVQVNVKQFSMTMAASKPKIYNNEQFYVTAVLTDAEGKPVTASPVAFRVIAGPATVMTSTGITDSTGKAITTIRAGNPDSATSVLLEASANINGAVVTALAPVELQTRVQYYTMTMVANKSTVDNNEEFFVTAVLMDSVGNPVSGKPVTFGIPIGPATINTSTVNTDSTGKAIATIRAGNPGSTASVIVEASTNVDGADVTAFAPVRVQIQPQNFTMTMAASKSVVDNNEEFYVTAHLKDWGGSPITEQPVDFEIAIGPGSVKTTTVTTDSTGTAIAPVRAGNPGYTTSIIVKASTNINGRSVTALAPVEITTKPLSESVLTMTLTSDKTTVGIESEFIASAKVTDLLQRPVQNYPVTFNVVVGPATVIDSTVSSDSTGKAVSRVKVGTTNSSSSVVLRASTTVEGVTISAYATIEVVRQNSYIINFLTTKTTTDPDGNLNIMPFEIEDPKYVGPVSFKQLVPFQVLDNNGVPKPNVDVTIALFNYGRNAQTKVELVPPLPGTPVVYPGTATIRTDDHGRGIFTCNVIVPAPGPGRTTTESITYSATATVAGNINLLSYGGFIATVTQKPAIPTNPPLLVITPSTAYFNSSTTLYFALSGGAPPYRVTASNPEMVRVSLEPDGVTVKATLFDTSAWTTYVSFSVLDTNGVAASVTPIIRR